MGKRGEPAKRPTKSTEFEVLFITSDAVKGWRDLTATAKNALADAWDCLSRTPLNESERQYKLRAGLGSVAYKGVTYDRWQYKVTNGARIWYLVDQQASDKHRGSVLLERVSPTHPKETE